jgi:hypothetical protein
LFDAVRQLNPQFPEEPCRHRERRSQRPLTTQKGVLAARVATTRQRTAVLPLRFRDQGGVTFAKTIV